MGVDDLPVTRDVVLDVALDGLHVDRVEMRRIVMAPNLASGAHVHNGPRTGLDRRGIGSVPGPGGGRRSCYGPATSSTANVRIEHFDALEDGVTFIGYLPLTEGQDAELTILDA